MTRNPSPYRTNTAFRLIPINASVKRNRSPINGLERRIESLERIIAGTYPDKKLAIKSKKGYSLINLMDVLWCQAASNYTHIHTADGTNHLVAKSLKAVDSLLPSEHFIRTHQSYVVNKGKIEFVDFEDNLITLSCGAKIPFSRMKKQSIKTELLIN